MRTTVPSGVVDDVDCLILFADSECDAARGHPVSVPSLSAVTTGPASKAALM